MDTETEFEAIAWSQIYAMLLRQAEKIGQSGFRPDVIVGIARGGWVAARVLSDLLDVPCLATVGVEFYVGVAATRNEPVLTQRVSVDVTDKKVLLVDDVADTGRSLQLARAHVLQQGAKAIRIATVYCKPLSVIKPDYYAGETQSWVIFPWDAKETIRKMVEKHRNKHEIRAEVEKLVKAGLRRSLVEGFLEELFEAGNC